MSELRDARLRKALQSAPDDGVRPSDAVRGAILERAHAVAAPAPRIGWWQRMWDGGARQGAPWHAAFATLAVASFVTFLWWDREIPDAKVQRSQTPQVATSPPASEPSATAPAPTERFDASAPAAASSTGEGAAVPRQKTESARSAPTPSPSRASVRDRARAELPVVPPPEDRAAGARATLPAPPPMPPPPDSVAQGDIRERRAAQARAALRDESRAAMAKTAPAPASQPMAAEPPAAPAARMELQYRLAAEAATQLRIESGGGAVDVPLPHPSNIAGLIARAAREARGNEPLQAPVDARLELRRDGQLTGVLELAGPQARWTAYTGNAAGGTAQLDTALMQALREALREFMR